ncbi:hypothetical protein BpHYR1_013351 [Brachionus plicatilis]|uniref:Uncharacterized protein n=1 Tax=Brachionus plicatilis TaxID=10195 RepID=A0A3M7Q8M7_BRAPC|nr:hypothetical protein BpHYR1_013351 [Brachionus plicatilis]
MVRVAGHTPVLELLNSALGSVVLNFFHFSKDIVNFGPAQTPLWLVTHPVQFQACLYLRFRTKICI